MPPAGEIQLCEEPYIEADIMCPTEYLSTVIDLCKKKRGIHVRVDYIDGNRCIGGLPDAPLGNRGPLLR